MASAPTAELVLKQSRNGQFSKTKLCRFELLGICAKGMQCPFAHGHVEMKALPDLRCTKLCKQLLSHGQCTTPNCSYAHSKEELRNAQKNGDGRQHGRLGDSKLSKIPKRGKNEQKEVVQAGPQRQQLQGKKTPMRKAGELPMPLSAPPGLEEYNGEGEMTAAALYEAFTQQAAAAAERKELELYTKALSEVLRSMPSNLASSEQSPMGPSYLPLRIGLGDSTGEGSGSDDLTEASTLAEEVAATALGDSFEDYHMESFGINTAGYDFTGMEGQAGNYGVDMSGQLAMADNAWGWNIWGNDGAWNSTSFTPYANMASAMPELETDQQDVWGVGGLLKASAEDTYTGKLRPAMKSARTSASNSSTLASLGDDHA